MDGDNQVLESPEEVLSTMSRDGKRRWLYPKVAKGVFYKYRKLVGYFLIGLYIAVPFIRVNGKPLLLLNLVEGEFVVFGKTFLATDTIIFLLLILAIGLLIIGATAVLGRVWCGWACPQTVYLEFVFRPIETWIEGSSAKRQKRDQGPISWDKLWRKVLKYSIYLFISAVLANAFLAYFIGSDTLLEWMQLSPALHPIPFLIMIFVTGLVLFDFSYFREQMCTIACPYARLQSVLLDSNSVIVGYDANRGEPRGKGRLREHYGDCIDCHQCVEVCPTGIDIRDGLQLECLHCAQCIDACDSVMSKVGKPLGLIRYSSLTEFRGGKLKIWRPRTILYLVGFFVLLFAFNYQLTTRPDTFAQILRASAEPYQVLESGVVSNHVRLKVVNSSESIITYQIRLSAPQEVRPIIPISEVKIAPRNQEVLNVFLNFPAKVTTQEVSIEVLHDQEVVQRLPYKLRRP